MNDTFPKPVIRTTHWRQWLVWIVPICAVIASTLYIHDYLATRGPVITVRFTNAEGIQVRDTPVLHRGVQVGQVDDIELSKDAREVLVHIRLRRDQADFAKKGAIYWTVRPEVSDLGLRGINTVFTGPYIDSAPGSGSVEKTFTALESAPDPVGDGVKLTLVAPRLEHLQAHSPVYYRGIQVGLVKDVQLGSEGNKVEAHFVIWHRYEALVKTHSRFWPLSGMDVKGGLFTGLDFRLESLRTLINGGISFATPDKDMGDAVKDGTQFTLDSEPKKDWLEWAPRIPINPESSKLGENDSSLSLHRQKKG
jgi:paraquat-inducible protein B